MKKEYDIRILIKNREAYKKLLEKYNKKRRAEDGGPDFKGTKKKLIIPEKE